MGNTASVAISPEKRLLKTTEQLVAGAELAELRRLTPEQEAAAATAAQRIREVAAAAKAAPKQEKAAPKYRGQYHKFNWQVEKYTLDGLLKDCWLTTMVSNPIPLGSSI